MLVTQMSLGERNTRGKAKAFPSSSSAPSVRWLWVHKEPGRDTSRTTEPSWTKGYPITSRGTITLGVLARVVLRGCCLGLG